MAARGKGGGVVPPPETLVTTANPMLAVPRLRQAAPPPTGPTPGATPRVDLATAAVAAITPRSSSSSAAVSARLAIPLVAPRGREGVGALPRVPLALARPASASGAAFTALNPLVMAAASAPPPSRPATTTVPVDPGAEVSYANPMAVLRGGGGKR